MSPTSGAGTTVTGCGPRRLVPALTLVATLGATVLQADPVLEQRLEELEQQVQALTLRLQALERRSAASRAQTPSAAVAMPADGVVWTFDGFAGASPLKVTHKAFDKATGRVDLLLLITAALPDPNAWTGVGQPVPLVLTLRGADSTEARADFTLVRGSRLEAGAHVHVQARVDPVQAAAARQLVIGHRAE